MISSQKENTPSLKRKKNEPKHTATYCKRQEPYEYESKGEASDSNSKEDYKISTLTTKDGEPSAEENGKAAQFKKFKKQIQMSYSVKM